MSAPPSWLRAHPVGVLTWLLKPGHSVERALFEHLLVQDAAVATDVHELARRLGETSAVVARALFALVRTESLAVHVASPSASVYRAGGLAHLQTDLLELGRPGQKLVLASDDGFCIASVSCTRYEEEVLAASAGTRGGALQTHTLRFGGHRVDLVASEPIDRRSPALLHLGRRLLSFYGPQNCGENGL